MKYIIIIIFSAVLIAILSWLISINYRDEKIMETLVKTGVIALLATFVLVVFQIFFSPLPSDKLTTNVLILRTEKGEVEIKEFNNKLFKIGSLHQGGYRTLNSVNIFCELPCAPHLHSLSLRCSFVPC